LLAPLPVRRTILISDDEPLLTNSFARSAQRRGFDVVADNSCSAPELALAHHPDVIVLDVHQPTSGIELLARLKANELTRDIPVIMVTAWASSDDRRACQELKADYLELKPLSADFWDRVEEWIDVKNREDVLSRS
jgi:CheY-like chemotaxis protein